MQTTDIAPHLEQLTRALGDKVGKEVSQEDLRDEFQKYLEYGVPVDQAVKTILRHHGVQQGVSTAVQTTQEPVPIAQLPPQSPFVSLRARVLSLNTREVQARGETKQILWGLLGDETGTVPYTSWRPIEGLEKGDEVAITGAYTKEWQGNAQVNLGDRTQVEKLEAGSVPKVPTTTREVQVADVRDGLRGLAVQGRILSVSARTITLRTGEEKTIYGGSIGDASGTIEFTSWHDHGLEEGQPVRIEGCYARSYRGAAQLNFDQDAVITRPEQDVPDLDTIRESAMVDLDDLVARGGGSDVTLLATLLEVRPGSGLVFRDKTTNRVVQGPAQRDGIPDLRIKAVLDDGAGAVNMVAGRELTEALLGKDLAKCQEEAREAFRHEVIQEELQEKLTGRLFRVTGNALFDEYGIMLIARSIQPASQDVHVAADAMLKELEAS